MGTKEVKELKDHPSELRSSKGNLVNTLLASWSAHASPAKKFGDLLTLAREVEAERDRLREREKDLIAALEWYAQSPDGGGIARSVLSKATQ